MSADLSAAVIAGAYLFAGFGVLAAVGMLPHGAMATLYAAGLAYVAGLAATMLVAIALVCIGVAVHVATFALVSVALGSAGMGIRMRRARRRREPMRAGFGDTSSIVASVRAWTAERWLVAVVGVVLVVFVVLGYRSAKVMPLSTWDAWSIWARKATILFDYGRLPSGFFTSPSYSFMHPDYPLLVPMLESIWFRVVGGADTQSLHVEFWLLFVASLGAAAYVAARVTRALIWAPVIGFVAVIPALSGQLMTLYADVPMGLLLMIGVLLLGMWIAEERGSLLALATLFLAASANTKNEGLTAAVCALAIAFLVTAVKARRGRRGVDFRALLISATALAVAVAPWRLWLAFHHISGDMPVGKGLDPSYLASRTDRISPTLTALYAQVTDQSLWHYLLPLGIGIVIACLIVPGARRAAAFYGLTGLGIFASLLWAYMINPNAISWYLATSANRSVDGMMFVAIAPLLHLTGIVLPGPKDVRGPATSDRGKADDSEAANIQEGMLAGTSPTVSANT